MTRHPYLNAVYAERHLWAIGTLLLTQLAFVAAYVGRESTIHFWDYAMYHDWARELFRLWRQDGVGAAWQRLMASMADNYNLIYALPSLASFSLFGDSRVIFVVTNYLVFALGWQLAMGWLVRRLFMVPWRVALFWTILAVTLLPPFWVPLVGGFPDHIAATMIVLALGLVLGHERGKRYVVLLGLCLGCAIILRRHYAYPAMGVMITAALTDAARILIPVVLSHWRQRQLALPVDWFRDLVLVGLRYGVSGVIVLSLIQLIAPDFLRNLLTVNYTELYKSYSNPPAAVLGFLFRNYGLLLSLAVVIGYGLLWRRLPALRQSLVIVIAAAAISFGLFAFGAAHTGPHHVLHVAPIIGVIGLIGLYQALRSMPSWFGRVAFICIMLALTSNTAWSLWLAPKVVRLHAGEKSSLLLSVQAPPERRTDLPQLLELGQTLIATSQIQDRIVIVGSSYTLNQDLIGRVLAEQLKRPDMLSRMVWTSEIDGRGQPPYDAFAEATIYVVPDKPQYHLTPEVQKVIGVMAAQFPPDRAWSKLFRQDETSFTLQNGVKVSLWRRRDWRPDMLASVMQEMQDFLQQPRPWVTLVPGQAAATDRVGQGSSLLTQLSPERPLARFFLTQPVTDKRNRLALDIAAQGDCGLPRLRLVVLGKDGRVLSEKKFQPLVMPGLLYQPFVLPPLVDSAYLSLDIQRETGAGQACVLQMANVRVEPLQER